MTAPLRAIPPSPAQLAADRAYPHLVVFGADLDALGLATTAVGLGIEVRGETACVIAPPAALGQLARELERRESVLALLLQQYLEPRATWQLRSRELALDRPLIMGIVNLTDDSFSGDGVGRDAASALARAEELRAAGADIIDVGAETARADRPSLDSGAEAELVRPLIAALVREKHLVSIDTYKPQVARAALFSGAEIVNDISGLTLGTGAADEAKRAGAGYVLNYSFSVPKRRPDAPPVYEDVVAETVEWMARRLWQLESGGMERAHIAIDPGIAFGKSHAEDIAMLRRLGELRTFGLPVLLAHSRKNFLGSISGRPPAERDMETHLASSFAYEQGARIFRVHDVAGAKRALELAYALLAEPSATFAPGDGSWPWRAGSSAAHMTKVEGDKRAPAGQRW